MDPRWQPNLGAVAPTQPSPEACDLLAAGWHAEHDECWIGAQGRTSRMVSPDTWRALRDRTGFVPVRVQAQRN